MSTESLPRMRIRRGRVMHAVRRRAGGDIESLCDRPHPVKGVKGRIPRASAPADWWTDQRYWYPDCENCPPQPILTPGAYLIWSNHYKCWWGPNGSGYRQFIGYAGRYDYADTSRWLSRGCDCCKAPEVIVPVPPAEVFADPERLREYVRRAPALATRWAIKLGQTNKYAS